VKENDEHERTQSEICHCGYLSILSTHKEAPLNTHQISAGPVKPYAFDLNGSCYTIDVGERYV